MSADLMARSPSRPAGTPSATLVWRTARQAARATWVWALGFGLYVYGSATGYQGIYKTPAARENFARTLGTNPGLAAMIGVGRRLDTVAGFTAWRCLGIVSVAGALWALLLSTRLLRGEEEAGRWELMLAGPTTRRRSAAQGLAGLGVGWLVLLGVVTVLTVAAGRAVTPAVPVAASCFFGLALAAGGAIFLATGALIGQLAATRRQAAGIAGVVLGGCYLLRALADVGSGLRWLVWINPLGWVERLQPLVGSSPLWLLPIVALCAVLCGLTVHVAGARDLGASLLSAHDASPAHDGLLANPARLAVRLGRGTAVAWLATVAIASLFWGYIARSAVSSLNPTMTKALGRIGATRGGVAAMLGLMFLVVATTIAIVAAGQAAATREEEAEGRLENLLVRPVSRWSWLAGRLALSAALVVLLGIVAGAFMWIGSSATAGGAGFGQVLQAGINAVPPALLVLGIGALVQSLAPRFTSAVVYGVIGWAFLIEFLGSAVKVSHWVMDTSIFFHITPAPAANPDWTGIGILVGLALACAAAAGMVFRRRDLADA